MASTKNIVLQNKLAQLIFETIKAGFYFFYFVGGDEGKALGCNHRVIRE